MTRNKDLMPFEPGALMHRMFGDFDRFFDGRGGFPFLRPSKQEFGMFPWSPEVGMAERNDHLVVTLDLPGMKTEEVSVELENGALVVSGERKKEFEEQKTDWFRSERTYGSFRRTIPVPDGVNASAVKATFTDGVLEVTMPMPAKTAPAATRIAIGEPSGGSDVKAA